MIFLTVTLRNGFSYQAGVPTDQVAAKFISRKRSQENVAFVFETAAEDSTVAPVPNSWTLTMDVLYPTCHHGLSAELCMDPVGDFHFGTREWEMMQPDYDDSSAERAASAL